jgi:hypothetical protein
MKFEEYVNSKKEILLPAKSFLSHMIEDAANKGVRHLDIGHYISFEGFKKSLEKNLVDVKHELMLAEVFFKKYLILKILSSKKEKILIKILL